VLIIEGVPLQAEELALSLIQAGYDVARVPNRPEALMSMYLLKPDLIIVADQNTENEEGCRRIGCALGVPVIGIADSQCVHPRPAN